MVDVREGALDGGDLRVGIAVARFNDFITRPLLDGALAALEQTGVSSDQIHVAWVPGAVELPVTCHALIEHLDVDAVIALGCVIKGETDHYDYVSQSATNGVADVALATGRPVIFGVLTCQTKSQARDRAGDGPDNKGYEAALTAIETANLLRDLANGGRA